MKHVEVSPLYKAKERNLLTNYRPISLLLVLSKILERVIYTRISSHMENNLLFYESQYGFRSGKSTTLAVT